MSREEFLLFLDSDLALGLMAGSLLALIVWSAAIFWLWKRPPRAPALLAVVYLLTASVSYVAAIASDTDHLVIMMVVAILSFPWSVLLSLLGAFLEVDLGDYLVVPGLMINAFLIRQIGKAAKNRNKQYLSDSVENVA
jgi:hypothetical protein